MIGSLVPPLLLLPLRESAARLGNFGLGAAELRAIGRDNALALLPRLGAAPG